MAKTKTVESKLFVSQISLRSGNKRVSVQNTNFDSDEYADCNCDTNVKEYEVKVAGGYGVTLTTAQWKKVLEAVNKLETQ